MDDDLFIRLERYVTEAYPDRFHPQVKEMTRINEGWESDVYTFQMVYGSQDAPQSEDLILRIYPGDDAQQKSAGEYRSLAMLHKAGYPVPQVYRLDRSGAIIDRPFMLMERILGRPMWSMFGNADDATLRKLLVQFCQLFVQLHTLDWRPYVEDARLYETGDPHAAIDRQFAGWQRVMQNFSHPDFEAVIQWLLDRRAEILCPRPSLIHWDFHPNNILVRADGSAVVIDWTGMDISDARFDLAWTLLLMTSYEGEQVREAILREYERQLGHPVEQLEFFDVAACLRRLASIAISIMAGAEKMGMRPGAQAKMQQREPVQRVYNLLVDRTGIRMPVIEQLLASFDK